MRARARSEEEDSEALLALGREAFFLANRLRIVHALVLINFMQTPLAVIESTAIVSPFYANRGTLARSSVTKFSRAVAIKSPSSAINSRARVSFIRSRKAAISLSRRGACGKTSSKRRGEKARGIEAASVATSRIN